MLFDFNVYAHLAQWLPLAAIAGAAWLFLRGGGRTALASLELTNRILEKRVHDLEQQGKLDQKLIAELQARTDVTIAIQPLLDWTNTHEDRDQVRFEQTIAALTQERAEFGNLLRVLEAIADKLGAEPGPPA